MFGSGKTIVALFPAMAAVVGGRAGGADGTDRNLGQHHQTLAMFGEAAGLGLALLTGRDTAALRGKTLARLAEGTIDIVIVTMPCFRKASSSATSASPWSTSSIALASTSVALG